MFAIAAILMLIGGWTILVCLLDWDPTLGVFDLQSLGETIGNDAARWIMAGFGATLFLIGLLSL